MATTKRSTKSRASARRATSTARSRVVKQATAPKKKAAGTKTKPIAKAKRTVAAKPARPAAPKQTAKKPAAESPAFVALKAKAQRERNALEKRLTEAVREIGMLRHHELRAMQLERQLAERDATIQRLQTQLAELERRPAEPIYVREVQQSLALGSPAREADSAVSDLDEFEDDRLQDDPDFIGDEE